MLHNPFNKERACSLFQNSLEWERERVNFKIILGWCTVFCLDEVSFLPSSLYGAMFWICDKNSLNTEVFELLLSSAYT